MTTPAPLPNNGPAKLHQLAADMSQVHAWIEENGDEIQAAGGELPPYLVELLDLAEGQLTTKAERLALVVKKLEHDAEEAEEFARNIKKLATTRANAVKGLKEYMKNALQLYGIKQVKGALAVVSVVRNSAVGVDVRDEGQLAHLHRRHEVLARAMRLAAAPLVTDNDLTAEEAELLNELPPFVEIPPMDGGWTADEVDALVAKQVMASDEFAQFIKREEVVTYSVDKAAVAQLWKGYYQEALASLPDDLNEFVRHASAMEQANRRLPPWLRCEVGYHVRVR